MIDPDSRAYRDGGGLLGGAVALDWARQALDSERGDAALHRRRLRRRPGPAARRARDACGDAGASLTVEEIDPDVFGEELDQPAYAEVERIAAVGALMVPASPTD